MLASNEGGFNPSNIRKGAKSRVKKKAKREFYAEVRAAKRYKKKHGSLPKDYAIEVPN